MKLQAIIWKEEDIYIIKEAITGVTTQGKNNRRSYKKFRRSC